MDIGTFLISPDEIEYIRDFAPTNSARMFKVLESWSKGAKSPTVGRLLRWFEQVDVSQRAIKIKYEELYGRSMQLDQPAIHTRTN